MLLSIAELLFPPMLFIKSSELHNYCLSFPPKKLQPSYNWVAEKYAILLPRSQNKTRGVS